MRTEDGMVAVLTTATFTISLLGALLLAPETSHQFPAVYGGLMFVGTTILSVGTLFTLFVFSGVDDW